MKQEDINLNRRGFLAGSGLFVGGLVVAFHVPSVMQKAFAAEAPAPGKVYPPNAFIQISPDNSIKIVVNKLEMGQGVNTSMAQLIAEELECDWKNIASISAPVDPVYNHTVFPMQMTGGSSALSSSWDQYRKLGAGMREMLKSAAAQRWGVPVSEVKAQNGTITHSKKGKLTYGELAEEANKLQMPLDPPLKKAKDFKVIGKSIKRVDAQEKSNGKAVFGMDIRLPGMLYAVVARPPLEGAELSKMNEKAARGVAGVVDVVKFADRVAVLANNTHAAKLGRDALDVRWKDSKNSKASTDDMMKDFRAQAEKKGLVADERGSVDAKLGEAAKTIVAEYEFPFLAHATMEPLNCTVNFDGKTADIWSGHQMPTLDKSGAAKALGIKADNVAIHTTYAGGSFGRRASKTSDYILEACHLAKVVKKPLKVVWTREDDMRGGYYRPMNFHKVSLGFDDKGKLLAWQHHIVGQSIMAGSPMEGMIKGGIEDAVVEGVAKTHYNLTNFRCEQTRPKTPMTTLWWRSVGHTHTAYVMETAMDEVAEQAKQDPLEMRRELLKNSPRHVAVIDLLKKQTGWGKKKPAKGRAWGVAVHESFNTVVGQVAEVSIEKGVPKIHQIWCAVHCGQVVNPEGAKTQVEGGIVYALSAALNQEIQVKDGQIVQGNFDTYPVMRIQDMPKVFVEFVKTDQPPTGLGEPGVPPAAPAVANAIYQLTKKRLRVLPFSKELLKEPNQQLTGEIKG